MKISPTLRAKRVKLERRAKGLPVYDAGLGENPFPAPEGMVEALRTHAEEKHYTDSFGSVELQACLGRSRLLVGNGLKPLLFTLMKSFVDEFEDHQILIVTPAWVTYFEQAKMVTSNYSVIETGPKERWKLTAAKLEEAIDASPADHRLLIFNNPTNPTGQLYTEREVEEIVEVAREAGLFIISDDIYTGVIHPSHEERFGSLLSTGYDRVVAGTSLSKTFATGGYRFGWVVFPEFDEPVDEDDDDDDELAEWSARLSPVSTIETREAIDRWYAAAHRIASSLYSCPSTVFDRVAVAALSFDPRMAERRRLQGAVFDTLGRRVSRILDRLGLDHTTPEAAWYVWIDFESERESLEARGISSSEELTTRLCEEIGLVTVPGSAFGDRRLALRYAFVDFDPPTDYDRLDDRRIVEGLAALTQWLGLEDRVAESLEPPAVVSFEDEPEPEVEQFSTAGDDFVADGVPREDSAATDHSGERISIKQLLQPHRALDSV